MAPRQFPAFELEASKDTFEALRHGLTGFAFGGRYETTWLRRGADLWAVNVTQRDLEFKFEVFSLAIESLSELHERLAAWKPPSLPEDAAEWQRAAASIGPKAPVPPSAFEPWPFAVWQTQVLRRAEFIIEDADVGPTYGSAPSIQSAAKPDEFPADASAVCEVAAGLLFTSDSGERLMIGVDWSPFNLVVTRAADEIDRYMESCEVIDVPDYLRRDDGADGGRP